MFGAEKQCMAVCMLPGLIVNCVNRVPLIASICSRGHGQRSPYRESLLVVTAGRDASSELRDRAPPCSFYLRWSLCFNYEPKRGFPLPTREIVYQQHQSFHPLFVVSSAYCFSGQPGNGRLWFSLPPRPSQQTRRHPRLRLSRKVVIK